MANDTEYGLSGYVSGSDAGRVQKVASQIRAGNVHVNGAGLDDFQVLGATGEVAAIEVAWPSGKKQRVPIKPGQSEVVLNELQNP